MRRIMFALAVFTLAWSGCSLIIDNGEEPIKNNNGKNDQCGECLLPKVCNESTGQCECDLNSRPTPTEWTRWSIIPDKPVSSNYIIDNSAGTVYDTQTCLTWMRKTLKNQQSDPFNSVQDAKNACEQHGFRLPTITELLTLVDYSSQCPAIDAAFESECNWYWTSTPFPNSATTWVVNFYYGSEFEHSDGDGFYGYARCVR